jgi:hypothetical protein
VAHLDFNCLLELDEWSEFTHIPLHRLKLLSSLGTSPKVISSGPVCCEVGGDVSDRIY